MNFVGIKNTIKQYKKPDGFPAEMMPDMAFPAVLEFQLKNISPRYANGFRRALFEIPFYVLYLKNIDCADPYNIREINQYEMFSVPIDQEREYKEDQDFWARSKGNHEIVMSSDMEPFCPCSRNIKLVDCVLPSPRQIVVQMGVAKTTKMIVPAAALVNQVQMNPVQEIPRDTDKRVDYNFRIHYKSNINHIKLLKNTINNIIERLEAIKVNLTPNVEDGSENKYLWYMKPETATIPCILSRAIYEEFPAIPFIAFKLDYGENPSVPYMVIRFHEGAEALEELIERSRAKCIEEWRSLLKTL